MPMHFYWNWTFEINPTDSIFLALNIQIFIVIYLHINSNISNDVKYLWLLLLLCSLSFYLSSACLEVLQSRVWVISSSFYFGHKNRLKLQFNQSLSIASLVILLQIRPILLDWSPSLPGSFAVLCVEHLSGSRSTERQLQSFLGQQAMALSLSGQECLKFPFLHCSWCVLVPLTLHPTYYIVVFVKVEDVADVTAILATAVIEAGHDVEVRARWKFGFWFSWILRWEFLLSTKYDCGMISYYVE